MKSKLKTVEEDKLKSLHPNLTQEELAQEEWDIETCTLVFFVGIFSVMVYYFILTSTSGHLHKTLITEIKIVYMDFAAELNDNSTITQQQSHHDIVSAKWDLLIIVPGKLVGDYMCLQGNLKASFLYKNITLATSSIQSYNKLVLGTPQLLNVSAVATKEDLSGAIGKEILDGIKERNEVWFGSRLSLTDCREETDNSMMNYECDEAKLRIEPGFDQIKATSFGNHPTCIINL